MTREIIGTLVLAGVVIASAVSHKTPAPASKTPASTEVEQDADSGNVPSETSPDIAPGAADLSQVSAVAPACTTCQPAAITPTNHRTQSATVPRQYQPQRRRLFGRWR